MKAPEAFITVHEIKGEPICFGLVGVLTFTTVSSLWRDRSQFFEKQSSIIFDLKELERTDSAGVAFFTSLLREAKRVQILVQFTNLPQQFVDIAHLVGLEVLFGIVHRSE